MCITSIQRRSNGFDAGPTLCKCYTNVLCLLADYYGKWILNVTVFLKVGASAETKMK